MKTLTLLALLCLPASLAVCAGAPAKTPETFGIPWDKALHFGVGYIATDVTTALVWKFDRDYWYIGNVGFNKGRTSGFFVATTLATLKESIDSGQKGNHWDWNDWWATVAGSGVAMTFNF